MSNARTERLTFGAGSRELVGHIYRPDGAPSGAGILFLHGWESGQGGYRPRAEAAASRLGATCLSFDLAGHGESAGEAAAFTPRQHLADAVAGLDLLAEIEAVDPRRIGCCGASHGAFLAASLITQRQAEASLLRAPALYPDSLLDVTGSSRRAIRKMPRSPHPCAT